MKIKLIRAPSFDFKYLSKNRPLTCSMLPPLGIATLTAYLKSKGVNVEQDDLNIKTHYDNKKSKGEKRIDFLIFSNKKRIQNYILGKHDTYLDEILSKFEKKTSLNNIDILGLSIPDNLENIPILITLSFARYLKEKYDFPIVIGSETSYVVLETFKIGGRLKIIDYAIRGEGQQGLYKLLESIESGTNLVNVPNLIYYENKKMIQNECIRDNNFYLPCFDGLPFDEYTVKQPIKDYNIDSLPKRKILILPYRFMKGCPNKCIFCLNSIEKQLIVLSPEKVADDLEILHKKYKCKYFFFLNATLNISNLYVNSLCDEIIKRNMNISWTDCARPDNFDKKTFVKMKEAGATRLVFGLETGSPRMLNYINKNLDINQVERNLKLCHEVGIWIYVEIIVGLPHENESDIKKTIGFINKNDKYIDNIFIHPFHLRPSVLLENPEKYGITNIRRIMEWANRTNQPLNLRTLRYKFDEIGGLKWKDKREQINLAWKKIYRSTNNKGGGMPNFETMPLLFYLYEIFDKNKMNVREIYNEVIVNTLAS